MAESNILESLQSHRHYLELKFKVSLRTSSLVDENFSIDIVDATPSSVALKPIDLSSDYNSIYRMLLLYYDELPSESGTFQITMQNLVTASGYQALETETQTYTYGFDNSAILDSQDEDETVTVEDHSIRGDITVTTSGTIYQANPDFYIVSSDPPHGEVFLDTDYKNGRIAITFNTSPDDIAVQEPGVIKVQRKKIAVEMSRWEAVATPHIALDDNKPVLYVYVGALSNDAVYDEPGFDYFESGYKYRVRISGGLYPRG